MAWDFSTEPEFQEKLDWVKDLCVNEIEPLDLVFPYAIRSRDPKIRALVKPIQDKIKEQGLWAIFLDEELGGPGFGQLKLGLLNEVIGRYAGAPHMFGAAAPDTGNMEMLAAYGTEEQKERWLKPLLNQDMFSAYSMTEPQGGSDPSLFKTHAVQFSVTASIGLAAATVSMSGFEAMLNAADEALYQAKEQGRNRVVAWLPPAADKLAAE